MALDGVTWWARKLLACAHGFYISPFVAKSYPSIQMGSFFMGY